MKNKLCIADAEVEGERATLKKATELFKDIWEKCGILPKRGDWFPSDQGDFYRLDSYQWNSGPKGLILTPWLIHSNDFKHSGNE